MNCLVNLRSSTGEAEADWCRIYQPDVYEIAGITYDVENVFMADDDGTYVHSGSILTLHYKSSTFLINMEKNYRKLV